MHTDAIAANTVTTPNGDRRLRLFPADNGSDFWVRLDAQIGRAVDRMTEGEHHMFCNLVEEHEAAGMGLDVAMAKACDEVFGGDRWRRFRRGAVAA